ncbi:PP2C family serine/threonine-protein phosphatase [Frankia sp. Cj3]|uniref:PP2C family protein-serine/threonine phosphatase n=1 Tax=Frankia sp. Cj3 TaxID=2880976 RepID=UPI001EF568C5|nr:PP2C family serine/threonine-protein phosphatase [Frankia sp. Cj3]
MDSSVVPITLIVVLLIGAILFVVVSSRASGFGPGPAHPPRSAAPTGSPRPRQRRRRRQGVLATLRGSLRNPAAATRAAGAGVPGRPASAGPASAGGPAGPGGPAASAGPGSLGQPAFSGTAGAPTTPIPPPSGEPPTTAYVTLSDLSDDRQPDVWSTQPAHDSAHRDFEATATAVTTAAPVNAAASAAGQPRQQDTTGWTPPPVDPPPAATTGIDVPHAAGHRADGPYPGNVERGMPGGQDGFGTDETAITRMSADYSDHGNAGAGAVGGPREDPAATLPPEQTIPPVSPLVANEPDVSTSPALRLAAAGRTRRGKRGGPNEDAFVVLDGLLAVADGVGGEAAGQIASTLAVTTVASFRPQYAADPRDGLRGALDRANRTVREKPLQEPSWHGMACTLDVVVLGRQHDTGETLFVAHVGDSTVWLQPGRGRPRRLTTPHAIKNGPLLNAIGLNEQVELDLLEEPVQAGDRVVLASDGITKVMTPEQLDGLLMELGTMSPEQAADALVDAAMIAGARDDTTIVVGDLVTDDAAAR